jgi:hypothetical protein
MNTFQKTIEFLKEVAPVINSFQNETVQMAAFDTALNSYHIGEPAPFMRKANRPLTNNRALQGNRKPLGATRAINKLLSEDFFSEPRTIGEITNTLSETNNSDFQTSEISGVLLKLTKDNKLTRFRNELGNRYLYQIPSEAA